MDTKNIVVGLIAVIALIIGVVAVNRTPTVTNVTNPPYGAVAGSDFPGPSMSLAGLYTFGSKIPLTSSASTTCQFRSPLDGTSTITQLSVKVASSSSSASIWEIGKSTTGIDATTTLIGTLFNVAGASQATWNASTTVGAAADADILAPGTWIAVKTAPQTTIKGSCTAEFQVN